MNETLEMLITNIKEEDLNICVYDNNHTKDFLIGIGEQYKISKLQILKQYNFYLNKQIEEQYEPGLEYQTFIISIFNAKNMTLKYIMRKIQK